MRLQQGLAVLILLGSLPGLGCYTMRFEIQEDVPTEVVRDRKAFFLWGLAPTKRVDVSEHCPNGAAAVVENTTFGDGMLTLITLGIYAPRSTWYHCVSAGGGS